MQGQYTLKSQEMIAALVDLTFSKPVSGRYQGAEAIVVDDGSCLDLINRIEALKIDHGASLIGLDALGELSEISDFRNLNELKMSYEVLPDSHEVFLLKRYSDKEPESCSGVYLLSVDLRRKGGDTGGLVGLIAVPTDTPINALKQLKHCINTDTEELRSIDDAGWISEFDDDDFAFDVTISALKKSVRETGAPVFSDFFAYEQDFEH